MFTDSGFWNVNMICYLLFVMFQFLNLSIMRGLCFDIKYQEWFVTQLPTSTKDTYVDLKPPITHCGSQTQWVKWLDHEVDRYSQATVFQHPWEKKETIYLTQKSALSMVLSIPLMVCYLNILVCVYNKDPIKS